MPRQTKGLEDQVGAKGLLGQYGQDKTHDLRCRPWCHHRLWYISLYICSQYVGYNSIRCSTCQHGVHKKMWHWKATVWRPELCLSQISGPWAANWWTSSDWNQSGDATLEVVDNFFFLLDKFDLGGGWAVAYIARFRVTCGNFWQLKPILTSSHVFLWNPWQTV